MTQSDEEDPKIIPLIAGKSPDGPLQPSSLYELLKPSPPSFAQSEFDIVGRKHSQIITF